MLCVAPADGLRWWMAIWLPGWEADANTTALVWEDEGKGHCLCLSLCLLSPRPLCETRTMLQVTYDVCGNPKVTLISTLTPSGNHKSFYPSLNNPLFHLLPSFHFFLLSFFPLSVLAAVHRWGVNRSDKFQSVRGGVRLWGCYTWEKHVKLRLIRTPEAGGVIWSFLWNRHN